MSILKEGIILKNAYLFGRTEKPYYCTLGYGAWSPAVASSEVIISSEVMVTRIIPTITMNWLDSAGRDNVEIRFTVNYPEDIIFNRIMMYYGGLQRSQYDIVFSGFNSVTIAQPDVNDFIVGGRVLINNSFYRVISSTGLTLGLEPWTIAPNLPTTGIGSLRDATVIPLIGELLDDVYQISSNNSVGFLLNGTSF